MNEIWRVVPEHSDYEVSSLGRLRKGFRVMRTRRNNLGYVKCAIMLYSGAGLNRDAYGNAGNMKRKSVHRLVASAFLGPCPPGREVNHKNGDKADNRPENLEYVTHRENLCHARDVLGKTLGFKKGDPKHPMRGNVLSPATKKKMSDAKMGDRHWRAVRFDLGAILELLKAQTSTREMLRLTGLKWTTLGGILRGQHWTTRGGTGIASEIVATYASRDRKSRGRKPLHS